MSFNSESRSKNAAKNAFSAMGNKMIILLLTFVSRRIFIQYIGVEYLGINGLFANILTLLSMADLGLGTAINVSLYKPIADNNTKRIAALLHYYRQLYIFISIGVTLLGLGLLPFLSYLVNLDTDIPLLSVYYVVFVLKNTASYLFAYKSSILRADQKTYVINKIEVWINISKVVAQIVIIISTKSYLLYILLDLVSIVIQNLIVSKVADKQYPFIKENAKLDKDEKKAIFSDTSSVFLYKIAWSLLNGTDNILMSIIVGTLVVGYYSNYYTITSNLEMFIALIFTSLTAGIGNLVATEKAEKRFNTFKTMQMVSFWLCDIVCVCLLFLLQDFIALWVGKNLQLDNLTVIAIVLNIFFSICMRPVWTFREGTGMYKQIRYIMFVTAILNLIISVVLGNIMGIAGIVFATSISKLLTYFWYEPYILFKNFFKHSVKDYYMDYIKNIFVLAIEIGACYIAMHFINGAGIFIWIIKAVVCLLIVNAICLVRYYKTAEFENIKIKIIGLSESIRRS